jgi:hypothetical protein
VKRSVQTGPKIQFGGFSGALFSAAYQFEMAGKVKADPIELARYTIASQ